MSHSFPQFPSPSPGSWRRDKVVRFDPSPAFVPLKVQPTGFEEPGALLKWTGWRADMMGMAGFKQGDSDVVDT